MSKIRLEREFNAAPDKVFAFVTAHAKLLEWWGPEGMTLPEAKLDFTRPGPWSTVFVSAEGKRFKVTGKVLKVIPPKSVDLTWAWHDENDARGHESHVRLEVKPAPGGGTHFTLLHSGLADAESATRHSSGWTSSLKKLERIAH